MSFLLDALKKSEQDQSQPSPSVFTQPVQVVIDEESEYTKADYFKPLAVLTIFALAIALAFLLGRDYARSQAPISQVSVSQTPAVVTPKTNEQTQIQAKVVTQVIAAPEPVQSPPAIVTKTVESAPITQETQRNLFKQAENASQFNQQYYQQPKQAEPIVLGAPPQAEINTEEEGKLLTGQLSIEESDRVSSNLLKRFEQALSDTAKLSDDDIYQLQRSDLVTPLVDMPTELQEKVPPLAFQTHIYSSESEQRWVKVNDKVVNEGEMIDASLQLIEILPQQVVLALDGEEFSLPALTDW